MNTNSYFTVEILSSGNINLIMSSSSGTPITVYYWKNKEPNATRSNYDGSITTTTTAQNISNLVAGDKIKFYRAETTALSGSESDSWFNKLTGTSQFKVSGNIASLVGFSETLPEHCFRRLFYYSSAIIDAGELDLPWNTLSTECYTGMFYACSSLTVVPSLPATNLADYCYQYMFRQCTSLTKAQRILPATTLVTGCYYWMFGGCTVLETAPELPALLLVSNCYYNLFGGCRALNYIKAMFTSTPGSGYTNSWVYNVAANGTFIKNSTATWTTSGQSGIPSGWTVKNMKPTTVNIDYNNIAAAYVRGNYSLSAIYGKGGVLLWGTAVPSTLTEYLTFTITTGGTIVWKNDSLTFSNKTIEYSLNDGAWTSITASSSGATINVSTGDVIKFKGDNSAYSQYYNEGNNFGGSTAFFDVSGNIMSLISSTNFSSLNTLTSSYTFEGLFKACRVVDASNLALPATTLTNNCYERMFYNCVTLTSAPELPATILSNSCYGGMFHYCAGLKTAPVLKATILASGCYAQMFRGCSLLDYVKSYATDISASNCLIYWLDGVSSTGTFEKPSSTTYPSGSSGIPSGWSIINIS